MSDTANNTVNNTVARLRELTVAVPYGMDTLLRLLDVVETTDIPTAAVPVGGTPRLLLNPGFVAAHCRTDEAFTMLILHELHHLLLGHTRLFRRVTKAHNIAFDAVINAMLCRQHPEPRWTALFRELYAADEFPWLLLRPPEGFPGSRGGLAGLKPAWRHVLEELYFSNGGTFFEVFELLAGEVQDRGSDSGDREQGDREQGDLKQGDPEAGEPVLLGNHDDDAEGMDVEDDPLLLDAIRRIVERWPNPLDAKVGRSMDTVLQTARVLPSPESPDRVFRRALLTAARSGRIAAGPPRPRPAYAQQAWPSRDRRAFAQAAGGTSPLLYATTLPGRPRRDGISTVDLYIDVSGSCHGYIPALLRGALSCRDLKPRFWQFSTGVVPVSARELSEGRVVSTGGTSGAAVTEHLCEIDSQAAVIFTDGWVGPVPADHHPACRRARLQVVLTPDGMTRDLEPVAAGFHQLENVR